MGVLSVCTRRQVDSWAAEMAYSNKHGKSVTQMFMQARPCTPAQPATATHQPRRCAWSRCCQTIAAVQCTSVAELVQGLGFPLLADARTLCSHALTQDIGVGRSEIDQEALVSELQHQGHGHGQQNHQPRSRRRVDLMKDIVQLSIEGSVPRQHVAAQVVGEDGQNDGEEVDQGQRCHLDHDHERGGVHQARVGGCGHEPKPIHLGGCVLFSKFI